MAKKPEKKLETTAKPKTATTAAQPVATPAKSVAPVKPPATAAKATIAKTPAAPAALAKKATVSPAKAAPRKASKSIPTLDEIRVQAYYVAEKRLAAGLPGDSASDWIQAEKELTSR